MSFSADTKEIKKLAEAYGLTAKDYRVSTGMFLNNQAFGTRDKAIKVIGRRMVVRNPSFVTRQLRVTKASFRAPIDSQQAVMGSVTTKRFSGWEEQESGETADRTRAFSVLGRRGNRDRKAPPPFRLKDDTDFDEPENYKGKNQHHRSIVMLQILGRKKGRQKPFMLYWHNRAKPGLYKFGRGRKGKRPLKMIQRFESPTAGRIKRVKWMDSAIHWYGATTNLNREWDGLIARMLKRRFG